MSHHDDEARDDAVEQRFPMSSADRARFWAGMNRFLETHVEPDIETVAETESPAPEPARVLRRTSGDDA